VTPLSFSFAPLRQFAHEPVFVVPTLSPLHSGQG
jgi:hypothetical protein